MKDVYIFDAVRTPVARYGGALSAVRPDDLAVVPMVEMMQRYPQVEWGQIDDVVLGCANQAGEDNRNVARMSLLLAGLPEQVPGMTVNRLCASGLNAIGMAAQTIKAEEAELMLAGGVESMSRAPFVMGKATTAFSRTAEIFDTTIGWRFINRKLDEQYGTDVMPMTAENVAKDFSISREDQDRFALWSQTKAATAQAEGLLDGEIVPVSVPQRKADPVIISVDEHPRTTSLETLAKLRSIFPDGSVTAGNASGVNDGAAILLLGSASVGEKYGLAPKAKVLGTASAGVAPRIMGMGPVPATRKLLERLGLTLDDIDIIELNEAFASQSLACTRELGLADDDPRINPLGGAIALGHPLGMSGARLVTTAVHQLQRRGSGKALCTMCVGVGQGVAMVIEKV